MFLRSIFVILLLKIVSAIAGDFLSATGFEDLFDWNLEIPGIDSFFHERLDDESADAMVDSDLITQIELSAAENLYFLYTRKNPIVPQSLYYNNKTSVEISNFDPSLDLVVLGHGWTGDRNAAINPVLRDAILVKTDVNVIVMDWCRLSYSNYLTASAGVPLIGQGLGMFLEFLKTTTGIPYEQMHLIGFSLGAHVVGCAGRQLNSKVAKITALDPAGPIWYTNPNRISKKDAVYVEVIHTNAGFSSLGINWDVGHADFYPNGGSSQPGCGTNMCSHHRAWEILAAAILYQHLIGKECSNHLELTLYTCKGKELLMGSTDLHKSGTGLYRFNTDMFFPYKIL